MDYPPIEPEHIEAIKQAMEGGNSQHERDVHYVFQPLGLRLIATIEALDLQRAQALADRGRAIAKLVPLQERAERAEGELRLYTAGAQRRARDRRGRFAKRRSKQVRRLGENLISMGIWLVVILAIMIFGRQCG